MPALNRFVKRAWAASVLIAVLFVVYGCYEPRITRVSDGREMTGQELMTHLAGVDIVFIGEQHNKKFHHKAQLELIKALKESVKPVAVGVEMFKKDDQEILDKWVKGTMGEEEFKGYYKANWGLPWSQYRDIFVYARENRVPLVGLNVPRTIIHQVVKGGFGSLSPDQVKDLPSGIECKVDRNYEEFIREALEGHKIDETSFRNFCEAQMVWDNAMANNAIEYLNAHPGARMAVLAGSGHSWKRGIPSQVKRLSSYSYAVILPETERLSEGAVDASDADYVVTARFF